MGSDLQFLTVGDIARRFGCEVWQVRRLFERGLLPPSRRIGAYRVIPSRDLPKVEQALRDAGYIGRNLHTAAAGA